MTDREFSDRFVPRPGTDYDWVYAYAKDRFAQTLAAFKDLEDKAASTITYLGGGTGLVSLGAVLSFSEGKISPVTVAACFVPLVLAGVSLVLATISRWTAEVHYPPSIRDAVKFAEHAATATDARAMLAVVIHEGDAATMATLSEKARLVEWSLRCKTAAIAAMLLPVLFAVFFPAVRP